MSNEKDTKEKEKINLPLFGFIKMGYLLKKYRKDMFWIVFTIIVFGAADLAAPILQRYALNHFVEGKTLDTMWGFILVYILVIIVFAVSGYFNTIICLATEVRMDRDMRNDAFAHLQELSFNYYNTNSVGYIHARVMSDTNRIGENLTWGIGDSFFFAIEIIGSIVVMFFYNVRLTFLVLLTVPFLALAFGLINGRLFDLNKKIRESNSKITGNFNEGISGAKTIKSLVIEEKIENDFRKETSHMFKTSMKSARLKGVLNAVTTLATSAALAIVLWKGGLLAKDEVGTFSLFMSYARGLVDPVSILAENLALFVACKVNIHRFTKLCEEVPNVKDSPEVVEKYGDCFCPKKENWEELQGDIEFKDVDFMYPDGDEYVLKNFNLKIPFGTNLAIVGETGAGKSTLVNLICRFFEPTAGQILIDGRDARERSQLWLHSSLGYVLQTPHLFSGTVRENLLYGKPDATEEDIRRALELVSAQGVVDKLENGKYDVVYGTYPSKQHNAFRNFGSWLNVRMLVWLLGMPPTLRPTSFYVAKRFVIEEMLRYTGPYPYVGGLLFRITRNIGEVAVNHRSRSDGTSGYTFGKLLGLWMNGFTAFSVKPLRLATWLGFICAACGFAFGLWTILKKLFLAPNMPLGYSSLMAVLLFVGGALMLILGLIGEYIGRIYICMNSSPQYVVAKEVGT